MKKTEEEIPYEVALAFMRGSVDQLQEEINEDQERLRQAVREFNNKFKEMAGRKFCEATGWEEGKCDSTLLNFGDNVPNCLRMNVGDHFILECPFKKHHLLSAEEISFSWSYRAGHTDYLFVEKFREFAFASLKYLDVYQSIIAEGFEMHAEFREVKQSLLDAMHQKEKERREVIHAIGEKQMEILLSGQRLYFNDTRGRALYTRSRRPENYRWIEITRSDPNSRTIDCRGLILEEKKRPGNHFYSYTGKELMFERKKVRRETLRWRLNG
jgi:hypothetical protein